MLTACSAHRLNLELVADVDGLIVHRKTVVLILILVLVLALILILILVLIQI